MLRLHSVMPVLVAACAIACAGEASNLQPSTAAEDVDAEQADSSADAGDATIDTHADAAPADVADAVTWVPFQGRETTPDVTAERLCADASLRPDEQMDPVNIDCELEGGSFAPEDLETPESVRVMVWNMERGQQIDAQLAWFAQLPAEDQPDILLLSEVDRGCSRSGSRDITREIAVALRMHYVFATEFVELPRPGGAGGTIEATCEHGNAILSRWPLGNVGWKFHEQNITWYTPPEERGTEGEPRLGGRVLLWADTQIGDHYLHLVTLHYESNPQHRETQIAQARETAELALLSPHRAIVGGDTNASLYWLDILQGTAADPTIGEFLTRGFVDAHASFMGNRATRGGLVLDLLLGDGPWFAEPRICSVEECGELSDHLPLWATVQLAP
ncbi:MAG: endonuclease/exonuclease/phosphatase family protein [Myxococcales bacterium]|nr:endonuclease/exonuclease/phosphatase family protein [Myxococcales bacterium]